ncbi:hypothetical protein B9K06_23635 [Bacillus sp. OG2]|nr:hypothetical protein B9K06_23635 [Bacillus sp. OG2]
MLGPQDAGHAGVATGRGTFSLRSLILSKRHPLFYYPALAPEPRVISHARIKGKDRLLFLRVLCWARRTRVMQALPQDVAPLACVP